jgi:Family of unknown function (DUF6535)
VLGHFKTRFGWGALHECCQRRQRKLDGLETWHLSTIIATLPIFLQLSLLLFFGITHLDPTAYGCKCDYGDNGLWSHILFLHRSGVAEISGLSVPDTCVDRASVLSTSGPKGRGGASQVRCRVTKWHLVQLEGASGTRMCIIITSIRRVVASLSRLPAALRDKVRSLTNISEAAGGSVQSGRQSDPDSVFRRVGFGLSGISCHLAQAFTVHSNAVHWILGTSTDKDIVTAAAKTGT